MYRWVWNVGKKRNVSDICFFSEEDCKADATASKPASEKASFSVETVWGPPPKRHVHIHVVFLYLLRTFIEDMCKTRCEGCKIDSSSQPDHMGKSGCLEEGADMRSEYLGEGLSKMNPSDVVTLYEKSGCMIGAPCHNSDILAETVSFYMDYVTALHFFKKESDDTRNITMVLNRC